MVSKFLTVTVGLTAVLTLSACEHGMWKGEPGKVVDARTGAPEVQNGPVIPSVQNPPGGVKAAHNFPPPNGRDLMVLTDKLGNSSVEIYDIDSSSPRTYGGGGASGAAAGGMPSSVESSVTVFPVEGGTYPGQMASTWPNSVLPVSNSGATGYKGGSASMSGGRASASVGTGYTPSQIFFKHGSSRLGNGDQQILRQVADQAKFSPVERVSIEGHASARTGVADPVEAKIINLKESMNRAFNVSSQLMRNGVPAEKIKTTVWGDTKNDGGSEEHNRRVDIITGGQ